MFCCCQIKHEYKFFFIFFRFVFSSNKHYIHSNRFNTIRFVGYPNIDVNGRNQFGFTIPQATIRRGGRCSSAKAYLLGDARYRANLHVVTFAFVIRVLFNELKEAVGVVFDRLGERHQVFATREVILSAGSIGSPQLLMLSGM